MTTKPALAAPGSYGCATTAHLLVFDEVGRWLTLRTARDHSRWQLPGGRLQYGESPTAAATRETREETGLELPAERLIAVAWIPASSSDRRDRISFIFSTRTLLESDLPKITMKTDEVDDWQFSPAHHAVVQMHPMLAERLTEAVLYGPGHYIEQDAASRHERTVMP